MGRGRWYAFAGLAFLVAAGMLAWRTGPVISAGQFDPVGAVGTLASLAVSVVALGLAVRAQRQVESDVRDAAARLAVVVGEVETEARRQLLGGDERTIDVEFSFRPAVAHNASGAAAKGALEEVVNYYRRLRPHRMVITGVAGSGKTVLAIELILGLLKDRGEGPVPVRMPAALLDTGLPPESAVRDWLVEHLTRAYRLPEAAARELVAARMVLPVLDGLDEMDAELEPRYASRAARTIRACNAYLDGTQQASLVLTCRLGQYQALEESREWVRDAAQIQIRPVGLPKARTFLVRRVSDEERWRAVLAAMTRTGNQALARALSTPWRLTLAAMVYDERDSGTGAYLHDPADLTNPTLDTEEKIRDHLLGLLIPTLTAVHHGPHPADRVHRWLGTLARYLGSNTAGATRPGRQVAGRELSETDLILHELWPLAGTRLPRAIPALVPAIGWTTLAAYLLTHLPTGLSPQQVVAVGGGVIISTLASTYWPWKAPWPSLGKFDLSRVLLRAGQRQQGLGYGLAVGLGTGLAAGFMAGLAVGVVYGLTYGLVAGVAAGLMAGLAPWLTYLDYSPVGPHEAVRSSITAGLTIGLSVGLTFGLAVGLTSGLTGGLVVGLAAALTSGLANWFVHGPADGLMFGLANGLTGGLAAGLTSGVAIGLAAGLMFGLTSGLSAGLAGWRYLALLLCTRRWSSQYLPWRLGRFLRWCYHAGLVRIAGTGYQFRHRELQEYLARHPTP